MLAHLPGRMSQPSRKGITSNIFILRCSFHKTAKRLSITGLTHLLRSRPKIQSSIVKALTIKVPNNKNDNFAQFLCYSYRHEPLFVVNWPQLYDMWFCYNKNRKEIRSIKKKLYCQWTDYTRLSNDDKTKITDWITSQKPISWRHPITLNNNITDISQKKDLPKKR